ncbi:RNA polymerase sigma factor, sigma-70 family [Chitinophaga rupis]|uniref:RNA polymerase sigma factor, sigma-70 family n=1 Tax=Chitinophaga rupis TaxID=573321 RepID=A0A1H7M7Q7_9BACT|nr:sigma-70 family RNA polymerase sigma factor [Chitinophaga rupis]SEL07350.1 RNA polymerase sigma factor, sigma-70 family [Chitinophaga rupis]
MSRQFRFQIPEEDHYLQLFIEGNERGFNHIYDHLYNFVFNYACNIIKNGFEIDSIVQDAFLRAWDHRKRMKNALHIRRFACLCVRWECYAYFKRKAGKSELNIIALDLHEETSIAVYDPEKEMARREEALVKEEQLQLIENAIPYLRGNRKTIVELLKRDFKPKKIAEVVGMSHQHVTRDMQRVFKELKRITDRLKKAADASRKRPVISVSDYEIYLNMLQIRILKLYYEKKYSFREISQELNLTPFQLAKQYFLVMRKINGLSKNRKKNS